MLNHPSPGVIASSHRTTVLSRSLFTWGLGTSGQLGDGTNSSKSSPVPIGASTNWTAIAAGSGIGNSFSLGISGGALFTWGGNVAGQLGNGATASKSSPIPIGAATNWTVVAGAGYSTNSFSLGIRGGALFSWGGNGSGQLGDGTTASKSSPVPIGAATNWTAISASGYSVSTPFSLGLRGGALFAWGGNNTGALGDGSTASKSSPVPIGAATDWTAISAGAYGTNTFSLGIRGGALFAWGGNTSGQLGDGTSGATTKSSPVPIGAATDWTLVAGAGDNGVGFSFGIRAGALFAWGGNAQGQLGDGTTASKSSPVPIGAATNWTAVAGGSYSGQFFSIGIRGGALFTWGGNSNGQLGNGTSGPGTFKSSPIPIGAITTWTTIAAHSIDSHALALRT